MPPGIIGGTIFGSMKSKRMILRGFALKHVGNLPQIARVSGPGSYRVDHGASLKGRRPAEVRGGLAATRHNPTVTDTAPEVVSSAHGPNATSGNVRFSAAYEGEADINRRFPSVAICTS
jgi:hypothetical protein